MGNTHQVANTFWQLVVLPAQASRWEVVTPPGVADNTGLVDTEAGATFVAGFEASQLLQFSPLALTTTTGSSWTQGVLDRGLAPVPDALAATDSGNVAALTNKTSDAVVLDNGPTSWQRVVTARELASSASGRRCGVEALTAVAYSPSGQLMMGASCRRPGQVGIWSDAAGAWHLVGPSLPESEHLAVTSTIRLRSQSGEVSMLLSVRSLHHLALLASDLTSNGHWSRPASLTVAPDDTLVSSGFGVTGAAVVMLRARGIDSADVLDPGTNSWSELPGLPAHTATVAYETDGAIDALAVDGAMLTAYRLNAGTSSWQKFQVLDVPIQYGSSS